MQPNAKSMMRPARLITQKLATSYQPAIRLANRLNCAQAVISVALCLVGLIAGGCGTKPAFEFDDLDLAQTREELTEFSLGHFRIPIPVTDHRHTGQPTTSNRFEFVFDLYALVSPEQESQIAAAWERHEGKVRDRVIEICRSATLEELQEPELATLKSHLTDAVQGQLGSAKVWQLLMTDVDSQAI